MLYLVVRIKEQPSKTILYPPQFHLAKGINVNLIKKHSSETPTRKKLRSFKDLTAKIKCHTTILKPGKQ